jgi:hypothetical protein
MYMFTYLHVCIFVHTLTFLKTIIKNRENGSNPNVFIYAYRLWKPKKSFKLRVYGTSLYVYIYIYLYLLNLLIELNKRD